MRKLFLLTYLAQLWVTQLVRLDKTGDISLTLAVAHVEYMKAGVITKHSSSRRKTLFQKIALKSEKMTLGADVRSRVNHPTAPHHRWRWLSVGGNFFVFVNFLNIYKYSLKARRSVMLCHLFSRRARSPGPLNKSSSLFLLRGKRLRHSWVLGVTSRWCWRRRNYDISVSLRQVKRSSWKQANVKSEEVRKFFAFAVFFRRLL